MSEPLRVAFVGEGPTDREVIRAALTSMLGERSFIFRQLHPEESLAFGSLGTGWAGVYRWCRTAVARSNGLLRSDVLYESYDILILHLDADVTEETYANGNIREEINDLPCHQPCPPPSASTNLLRGVLLRWVGEVGVPPRTVFCTPSKNMEAWVLAALFPNDEAVQQGIECWANPGNRLGQQPIAQRIQKKLRDYERRAEEITAAWPHVAAQLTEAERFQNDFLAVLPR